MEGIGHLGHGLPVVDHGHDVGHEPFVRLGAHDLDESLGLGIVKLHPADAGENVDLFQLTGNGGSVLGRQLGASDQ